jgi:hypothetical protein
LAPNSVTVVNRHPILNGGLFNNFSDLTARLQPIEDCDHTGYRRMALIHHPYWNCLGHSATSPDWSSPSGGFTVSTQQ